MVKKISITTRAIVVLLAGILVFPANPLMSEEQAEFEITPTKAEIPEMMIYLGLIQADGQAIKKPHCIDFQKLIETTAEFRQVGRDRLEKGCGKYWLLMNFAAEKSMQQLKDYAKSNGILFVVDRAYFIGYLYAKEAAETDKAKIDPNKVKALANDFKRRQKARQNNPGTETISVTDKKDEELLRRFDITDPIVEIMSKQKQKSTLK